MFATWQVTGEFGEGRICEHGLTFTEAVNRAAELKLKGWRNVKATIEGPHAAWKPQPDQTEEIASLKTQLAAAEKRAEEASLFLQDEMKKAADWYLAHKERKEELEDCQSRLAEAKKKIQRLEEWKYMTCCHGPHQAAIATLKQANKDLGEMVAALESRLRDAEAREVVLDAALAFHDDPTNNEKAERFSKACHTYKEAKL